MWHAKTSLSPAIIDNDHDGLYDNSSRYINETSSLPEDPDPEVMNAPRGLLDQYSDDIVNGRYATTLTNSQAQPAANPLSGTTGSINDLWLSLCVWFADSSNRKAALSFIGCYTLGFFDDNLGIAAHSKYEQFQRDFGYCDLYDAIFKIGTNNNMDQLKPSSFNFDGRKIRFWAWRGDYLNLGTGGELGIYCDPVNPIDFIDTHVSSTVGKYLKSVLGSNGYEFLDWWSVAPYELPMRLSVYNKQNGGFSSVLNWFPQDYQWWITGFNYHMWNPDVHKMYMITEINFNDSTSMQVADDDKIEMFLRFKAYVELNMKKNSDNKYVLFDNNRNIAYIIWGEL